MCAGIADCFAFLSGLVFTMTTLFGYVIAALVLQRKPEHLYSSHEEEAFWRSVRLEPSRTARDLPEDKCEVVRQRRRQGTDHADGGSDGRRDCGPRHCSADLTGDAIVDGSFHLDNLPGAFSVAESRATRL
jgi:hypothetical protein